MSSGQVHLSGQLVPEGVAKNLLSAWSELVGVNIVKRVQEQLPA